MLRPCNCKMKVLTSVILLVAVCRLAHSQQPPPNPPKMNDTFQGSGSVTVDVGDHNVTGTCELKGILGRAAIILTNYSQLPLEEHRKRTWVLRGRCIMTLLR